MSARGQSESSSGAKQSVRILGIESSCDETGAAIVENGRFIRANVVASQASVHERYGGVVPEVASRRQLSAIIPVLESTLTEAGLGWDGVDAIAATYGPGLAGSLLVGLTAGKTIALARGLPFLGVNHLEAHIYANWLREDFTPRPPSFDDLTPEPPLPQGEGESGTDLTPRPAHSRGEGESEEWPGDPSFPLLALVISGAHSELVYIPHHGRYELLGQTRDDAAGEAFDKVARVLGLGYPGGPAIERSAAGRDASAKNPYRLPRAWLNGTNDFSFSGLKTAVVQLVEGYVAGDLETGASKYTREGVAAADSGGALSVPDVAAAFQDSVVDVLATKTLRAVPTKIAGRRARSAMKSANASPTATIAS